MHSTADESASAAVAETIRRHAMYSLARPWGDLSKRDLFWAVALSVRDRLVEQMLASETRACAEDRKRVHYLSMEFMIGRLLGGYLDNLQLRDVYRHALGSLHADLDEIEAYEGDAALGNGGLGRLAACLLDSLATLGLSGYGHGILYEYGLFKQEIDDGHQREKPDNWLAEGSPWTIARPSEACLVPLYGRIEHGVDRAGGYNPMWMDWRAVVGVPHDIAIAGYGGATVNFLRLYSARASRDFDIRIFNEGDYFKAVEQKISSETVSKILYPMDTRATGRELRLVQEYFLVACAVRDILRTYERSHEDIRKLASKVAVQLNDTHPTLAVAELMRILVDERDLAWDEAWTITQAVFGFTNHTLAPEALEKWPVPLLEHVIPRHLQIIFEINRRLLESVATVRPGDDALLRRISIIEEAEPKQVRMTHLAMAGSHSVNGVSAIHSELVKTLLAPDFFALEPEKFQNVTNGITPRAWLLTANPALADLITEVTGGDWITDLARLRKLEERAADSGFQDAFLQIKRANKERLARIIREHTGIVVDAGSLFDVHAKRIHLYKRQLLKLLHIADEYLALLDDGRLPATARTYVFAGKAAPGYQTAKSVLQLVHCIGRAINTDRRARDWMRVVFLPDYRVSLAQKIIPAGDLSEQISTAGTEASGTGNMKLALNGAITMGTLDGANIEIRDEVGAENMFVFGLDAAQVKALREGRSYRPREVCDRHPRVRRVVDALRSGRFAPRDSELLGWAARVVLDEADEFVHLADLPSYLEAQALVDEAFRDRSRWAQMAILNVARIGKFSSDRAVLDYARGIWRVSPPIQSEPPAGS